MVRMIIALLFLVPCGIRDLRRRTVPVSWLAAGALLAVVLAARRICGGEITIWNPLFAASPGVLLLALSWMTERQIGVADGVAACILGVMLGSPAIYLALMSALVLSSGCSIVLLASRRGHRHTQIPWLPFLAAGVVVTAVVGGGVL